MSNATKKAKPGGAAALVQRFARRVCTDTREFASRQLCLPGFGADALWVQALAVDLHRQASAWIRQHCTRPLINAVQGWRQLVLEANDIHQLFLTGV